MTIQNSSEDRVTAARLQQRLLEEFGATQGGPNPDCAVTGPVRSGANAQLFRAEHSSFSFPLALKRFREFESRDDTIEIARRQFQAMRSVLDSMGDEQFSIPRMIAFWEDEVLLVMEWIPGRSLSEMLFDRHEPVTDIMEYCATAGQWLRRFHAGRTLPPAPLNVEGLLNQLSRTADEGNPWVTRDSVLRRGRRLLEEAAPDVSGILLPQSWVHGDFKPENLIIAGKRAVGIDLGGYKNNAVVFDITHFLTDLQLSFFHPKMLRLRPSAGQMVSTFLRAYGGTEDSLAELPLLWLRLHEVIRFWISGARHARFSPRSFYRGYCYRSCAKRLISSLART